MKFKSILLISNLYPNGNEPTRGLFIQQLAESLNKEVKVTVVAPLPYNPTELFKKSGKVPSLEKIGNITVYHPRYLVIPKLFRSLTGYFFYFGIKKLVERLKRENKADIISSHWLYPDGFAATLIAKRLDCPIALHALGCDINEYTKYKLRRKFITSALTDSSINIVKSQALKDSIVNLGVDGTKVHVVHNGVDQNKFHPHPPSDVRKKLGLSSDKKYCLFIGNFQIEKGLKYLISATSLITQSNIEFLIVGSGPLESEIKQLAEKLGVDKKITFLGRVAHDLIPEYMSAADLLCLPSLREGCPNVVLESLSCGTPVVASNVGAVPDIITSDKLGVIVPPQNPQLLAEGITKGLNIRKENMPEFEWYSWEENSKKILQLFDSIIE